MSVSQRGRSASVPHSRPPTSASTYAPSRLRPDDDDRPHIAGPAECLCPACHLKTNFFPRRQDGRIVLPPPNPTRLAEGQPHVVGSSVSMSMSSHGAREAREAEVPMRRLDIGEGTSAGSGQLSGPGVPAGAPEDWTHLPPLLRDFELPYLMGRGTPRMPPAEIHPSRPDRPKPSRKKPYDAKPQRPEPWPRISSSGFDQIQPVGRSRSRTGEYYFYEMLVANTR
ncbi:hypothetical protein GALMADRAFT_449002 [Galerina marginata CBS 339.88]|uniref:Uncharacterized protein n=1 Tax=Galerina marginata (strain CBS 339.88) TaxID=685588 RepID=A0A067T071_GALM3|nr:hypothetical protein GALMADRAFT_449002 [Galerina marginata CBS 339.88]